VVDTSGPALATALAEGVFLIKPNLRELQELVGAQLHEGSSRLPPPAISLQTQRRRRLH
jgi:6-phosphofructokinase 2